MMEGTLDPDGAMAPSLETSLPLTAGSGVRLISLDTILDGGRAASLWIISGAGGGVSDFLDVGGGGPVDLRVTSSGLCGRGGPSSSRSLAVRGMSLLTSLLLGGAGAGDLEAEMDRGAGETARGVLGSGPSDALTGELPLEGGGAGFSSASLGTSMGVTALAIGVTGGGIDFGDGDRAAVVGCETRGGDVSGATDCSRPNTGC